MSSPSKLFPQNFNRMGFQAAHFLGIPIFTMAFVLMYNPFDIQHILDYGNVSFTFNISIVLAITAVDYLICRLIFYFTRTVRQTGWLQYFAWVFLEVITTCLFLALYLCLIKPNGPHAYFYVLLDTLRYFVPIVIYPYLIITLVFYIIGKSEESASYKDNQQDRVKFYDSSRNLKLIVSSADLLYIEAQDNYICIHYTEKEALKQYVLRSSMAAIDDLCRKAGLLRCHRSYFVKVNRISVLSKDKEGMIFAQMDDLGCTKVPVTKRYYDTLSSLL